ncbi:MAG: AAA family ATPase [Bryobacterales bacterium]|nr:AAA family ATPase [Bryobacterales bacterium]
MLQRLLLDELLGWKKQANRKPVLVDGARQVGKTYLIEQIFGKRHFRKVHLLDFRKEPSLDRLFAESLEPRSLVFRIELHTETPIDLEHDLIVFDEVGDCQRALDSLKYFASTLPHAFVCATGSNIGLLDSFPVGAVRTLELFPLCFEEFLMAAGRGRLLDAFRNRVGGRVVHQHLWSQLLDYYFVGGMPEAVARWFADGEELLRRTREITAIQRDLVTQYERDFGKYAGRLRAQHIGAVFSNVPRQLAASLDGSVRRFRFKGVIARKRGYQDLAGPIEWLHAAKLVRKCFPINGKPTVPLLAQSRPNIFRLYMFDVGLLGHMLGMTYEDQRAQSAAYKGFIAENFVQNELGVRVSYPTYGWHQGRAEIEFIHRCSNGEVIPVEVKSGARTRARSLRSFLERYGPSRAVKLAGSPGGEKRGALQNWPLYEAQFLRDL